MRYNDGSDLAVNISLIKTQKSPLQMQRAFVDQIRLFTSS
jgi:hypothetical protein